MKEEREEKKRLTTQIDTLKEQLKDDPLWDKDLSEWTKKEVRLHTDHATLKKQYDAEISTLTTQLASLNNQIALLMQLELAKHEHNKLISKGSSPVISKRELESAHSEEISPEMADLVKLADGRPQKELPSPIIKSETQPVQKPKTNTIFSMADPRFHDLVKLADGRPQKELPSPIIKSETQPVQKPKTNTIFSMADPRFHDLVKLADGSKQVTIVDGSNVLPRNPSKSYPQIKSPKQRSGLLVKNSYQNQSNRPSASELNEKRNSHVPTQIAQVSNQYQNQYSRPSVSELDKKVNPPAPAQTTQPAKQITQPTKTRNIFSKADPRFQELVNGADKNKEITIVDGSNVLPRNNKEIKAGKSKPHPPKKSTESSSTTEANPTAALSPNANQVYSRQPSSQSFEPKRISQASLIRLQDLVKKNGAVKTDGKEGTSSRTIYYNF